MEDREKTVQIMHKMKNWIKSGWRAVQSQSLSAA